MTRQQKLRYIKIIIILNLIFFSKCCFAQSALCTSSVSSVSSASSVPFESWTQLEQCFWCDVTKYYFGLGIGPENVNFKQKAFVIERGVNNVRAIDRTHFAGRGAFGSLFAGGGLVFSCNPYLDNFYLGLEANANIQTLKFNFSNEEFVNVNFNHTTYQMQRDLGISALPGLLFSNCTFSTLFYVRLGCANGKFQVITTDTSLQNIKKNLNGFRYGLGVRQYIDERWSFRLEYSQTDYQKAKMFIFDPARNFSKTTFITPHTQRFEIAIIFTL